MSIFAHDEQALMVGACSQDTGFDADYLQSYILDAIRDGMTEAQATKYVCELAYEGDL